MPAQFVIGIDLGTTNSVLAYSPLNADQPEVQILPIPQGRRCQHRGITGDAAVVPVSVHRK
jgi:molecular chaperone DnaK (HSP70)